MANTARLRRFRRVSLAAVACAGLGVLATSCQERRICPAIPRTTAVVYGKLTQSSVDKVDLLLAIDNSRSMADKQALLALAVPDLIEGLVNPPCLDATGAPVVPGPAGPLEVCPKGSERPFEPILDIHVGVITSSLGGHGADVCDPSGPGKKSNDDHGHLVFRPDEASPDTVPTYEGKGFLAWDPAQQLSPPGEADLAGDTAVDANDTALVPVLRDLIVGAGDAGCGYESQLESWYRFLADPAPFASIEVDASSKATPEGIDQVLLDQRKAFLRPDSLLGIVLLTDENDCSVRDQGQFYYALQQKASNGSPFHLPRARAVCATSPDDPCCFSCGQAGPKDDDGSPLCGDDPTCKTPDGKTAYLDDAEDPINLRCWDQKRRFGIDFLYPIDRYTRALTEPTVVDRSGQEVPNPIFSDLDPSDSSTGTRTPSMVVFAGIVGVPWQDVARDPKDLKKGLLSATELEAPGPSGQSAWDLLLGDPEKGVSPSDPLMIESRAPRSGVHPITGEPVATWDTPLANSINGHDYDPQDDLQYACVFDLPAPLDCADPESCSDAAHSPVYDPPYDQPAAAQPRAGARPGPRILSFLRSIGDQGVVASACPAQTTDPGALDFGYRPAIEAMLGRLKEQIAGRCLARTLDADGSGQVECRVIEARRADPDGTCCDPGEARIVPPPASSGLIEALKQDDSVVARGLDCFCEIPQLTGSQPGEELYTCQNDTSDAPALPDGEPVDGYCYVDAASTPPVGNPEIVQNCPATERRILRFVGKGHPTPGAVVFLTCGTADYGSEECVSE